MVAIFDLTVTPTSESIQTSPCVAETRNNDDNSLTFVAANYTRSAIRAISVSGITSAIFISG